MVEHLPSTQRNHQYVLHVFLKNELPSYPICGYEKEIQVQECKKCLIEEIKWPKEEKDSSSFLKAEMTTSESPLTIKEGRLRSIAKVTAPLKASGPDGMPSIFY